MIDPGPEDFPLFTGCYRNVGLDTTYRVVARNDELVLTSLRFGEIAMTHLQDDVFSLDSRELNRIAFLHEVPNDLTTPVVAVQLRAVAFGVSAVFPRCSVGVPATTQGDM